jgi:uncharacterized membrane protein
MHSAVSAARPRLEAIDFLRGLVMVLMVLDHMRDYAGAGVVDARDVRDPVLFLTRWITHYCAPIFVMLSGVAAFLYGNRGRTRGEISRFLVTRGMWLILVELTLVRFAFTFNLDYSFVFLQVIWAIGCSLVVLAVLIHLPHWAIASFGLVLIAGHNALDGVEPASLGALSSLWIVAHGPGTIEPVAGTQVLALYSLIPWIGVAAVGYALGPVFLFDTARRRRVLSSLGVAVVLGFIVLRASNVYGDPQPWVVHDSLLATGLSFVNCEKYPPSLLYLAMTLGPGLIVAAWFDAARGRASRLLVTIGRVPFLFYVAHLFIVHLVAVVVAELYFGSSGWLFERMPPFEKPAGFGVPLPAIYLLWIVALAVLYPLCRWFGEVKQRRKDWWLSYL